MADQVLTKQKLIDANEDVQALEDVVNGNETKQVTTRLGENYPSVKKAIKTLFENGGLPAAPFATKALMTSSALVDGQYAMVTDDTVSNGLYVKTAGAWVKSKYNPLIKGQSPYILIQTQDEFDAIGGHVDNIKKEGLYFIARNFLVSSSNGFPVIGTNGFLQVIDNGGGTLGQKWVCAGGFAYRWGVVSSNVWQPWGGVNTGGKLVNILDFDNSKNPTIVTSIDDIGGSLDNATDVGRYIIERSALSTPENGFPVGGSSGILDVIKPSAGVIFQLWQSQGGHIYRWGLGVKGQPVSEWKKWSGVKYTGNSIVSLSSIISDIALLKSSNGAQKTVITYGSSTLELLSYEQLQAWAIAKGYAFYNRAIGGDVIGGVGQAQGSNIVKAVFEQGVIKASGTSNATLTASFTTLPRQDRQVTLSNGVKGTMTPAGVFTASNLIDDLAVIPSIEFRVLEPDWYKKQGDLYLINIGKNDVSTTDKDAQWMFDRTQDIINYLPRNSDFVVMGHFTNYNSSSDNRTRINAYNEMLRSYYGLKYIDLNDILHSDEIWQELGLTKTESDITAINNQWLPLSLARDAGSHLNTGANSFIANKIIERLEFLGYTD